MGELVLPSALTGRPFTVREARAAGLRYDELRQAPLHAPTWAVRCVEEPGDLPARAAAFARGLPDDIAFSHVTAARLWQLPLPSPLEQDDTDLDVIRDSAKERIRRRRCRGHKGLERRELVECGGLRVVGLADTWVDLGEVVGLGLGLDDLVVAGDAVARQLEMQQLADAAGAGMRGSLPVGAGAAILGSALHARVRPRGKALLGQALPLVRSGSRSAMETRARLMFHRAGFPEPELNAPVRDAHGGWLLEGDLVWRRQRVIGEYQGADHGSIKRRSADASRAGIAEDHDYRLLEIYSEDVFGGARRRACLHRFARALEIDPAELTIG
jgi:hypothetical protein